MVGPVPGSLGKADRYGIALSLAVSGERCVRTVGGVPIRPIIVREAARTSRICGTAGWRRAGHLYEPATACALQQNRLHAFSSVTA
jgi:hypothetical protein